MPHRHHPDAFKREVCHQIRSGLIGRREAQRRYLLSDNLLQIWLSRYDAETVTAPTDDGPLHAECEARIAVLERKVGQLTIALEDATSASASTRPTASRAGRAASAGSHGQRDAEGE